MVKEKKIRRAIKNKYALGVYKPNKNCKPVTYNGTKYLSKAQCMALEGITRKELDAYLNGALGEINEAVNAPEERFQNVLREVNQDVAQEANPDEIPDGIDLNDIL